MKSHLPLDTLFTLTLDVPGVRSGISLKPVDTADRVSGRSWVSRAAQVTPDRIAMLRQVHGAGVVQAPWEGFPQVVEGDALITSERGIALTVRVADCAPVALATADGGSIGLIHAGWRGVISGVVGSAVKELCLLAGSDPGNLRAAVGPTIGLCCYEVGSEFEERFPQSLLHRRQGRLSLALPGVGAVALEEAGVPSARMDLEAAACTACGRGARDGAAFHSHRASGGGPGRNIAFIVRDETT